MSCRLKGHVFCCTGLSPLERAEMQQIVERNGGSWSRHLTNRVTHLLCKVAEPSDKYKMAQGLNMAIVHPDWIYSNFSNSAHETYSNNHGGSVDLERPFANISKYLLKPLTGAVVSVSGLLEHERTQVFELCSKNGAIYSSDLTKKCTHLIIPADTINLKEEDYGIKIVYALKWSIPTVSIEWLHICIQSGYIVPATCSTGSKSPSWLITLPQKKNDLSHQESSTHVVQQEKDLSYLKGYTFYFGSKMKSHMEDLVPSIEGAGGRILGAEDVPDAQDLIFLVSSYNLSLEEGKEMIDLEERLRSKLESDEKTLFRVVHFDWVKECKGNSTLVPCDRFLVKREVKNDLFVMDDKENTINNSNIYKTTKSKKDNRIFAGKAFFIDPMHKHVDKINKLVKGQRGTVVTDVKSSVKCDYYVVSSWFEQPPNCDSHGIQVGASQISEFITHVWIEKCVHDLKLHAPSNSVFYKPFPFLKTRLLFLQELHVSITGFESLERGYLSELFEKQEAALFPHFTKKMDLLLCPCDGDLTTSLKFASATKWNVPVVKIDWLWACFEESRFVDPQRFIVNKLQWRSSRLIGNTSVSVTSAISSIDATQIPKLDLLSPISASGKNIPDQAQVTPTKKSNAVCPLLLPDEEIHDELYATRDTPKNGGDIILSQTTPIHTAIQNSISHALHRVMSAENKCDGDRSSILRGVHCCFSQRLWHRREELTELVKSMGGSCSWSFSEDNVTHLVHQGNKAEERFKEFKFAKNLKKWIVSPWWIIKSREHGARLPERDYPHTFDPLKHPSLILEPMKYGSGDRGASFEIRRAPQDSTNPLLQMINQVLQSPITVEQSHKPQEKSDKLPSPVLPDKQSLPSSDAVFGMLAGDLTTRYTPQDSQHSTFRHASSENVIYDHEGEAINQKKLLKSSMNKACSEDDPLVLENELKESAKDHIVHENEVKSIKNFLFSSISTQQQPLLSRYIERLGHATVIQEGEAWSNQCTHLIAGCPSRSEKYLAAIVCGVFICKVEYIEASSKAGTWLDEEEYLWKAEDSANIDHPGNKLDPRLFSVPEQWRKKLNNGSKKCFHEWKVFLDVAEKKKGGLKRLLEAGGALVVVPNTEKSESFNINQEEIAWTHIITDHPATMNKKRRQNVPVFSPDVIVEALLEVK